MGRQIPNLQEKLDNFKTEHIHYDEEIRLIVDGSGYFDVKDENDQWVRVVTSKGQLIILPAGKQKRCTRRSTSPVTVFFSQAATIASCRTRSSSSTP